MQASWPTTKLSTMLRVPCNLLSGLSLVALPAIAAPEGPVTGITRVAPAAALFVVAAALLLTLVFRSSARHLLSYVGSRFAKLRVRRALSKHSGDLLHDIILPGAYGGLVRIDYAIMTAGGILCIRAMPMSGTVFGDADEPQWSYIDGPVRRRFLNPLIQNEGRAQALRNVVPGVPVENLVIFTGDVEFPTPPPKNVIRLGDLQSFIAKFVFGPSKVDDWDAVLLSLKAAALDDSESRKDFAAQIGFS